MRVICKYAEFNATAPTFCGQSLEFGEYEDYCIYILDQSCEENFTAITKNINSKSCTIELNSSDRFAYRVRENIRPIGQILSHLVHQFNLTLFKNAQTMK